MLIIYSYCVPNRSRGDIYIVFILFLFVLALVCHVSVCRIPHEWVSRFLPRSYGYRIGTSVSYDDYRRPLLSRLCIAQHYRLSRLYTTEATRYSMSRVMRKPDFCICENKDADQLRGNREADQRLCFRYTDRTIPLLPKSEISSF